MFFERNRRDLKKNIKKSLDKKQGFHKEEDVLSEEQISRKREKIGKVKKRLDKKRSFKKKASVESKELERVIKHLTIKKSVLY